MQRGVGSASTGSTCPINFSSPEQRLKGELIVKAGHCPHSLNIFSETTGLIEVIFHMKPFCVAKCKVLLT